MEIDGNKRILRELASPCHGKSWNYPPFSRKSLNKEGGGVNGTNNFVNPKIKARKIFKIFLFNYVLKQGLFFAKKL